MPEVGEEAEEGKEGDYVISHTRRGAQLTLHRRHGCWRAARLAFAEYEVVPGPTAPEDHTGLVGVGGVPDACASARCRDATSFLAPNAMDVAARAAALWNS